MVFRVATKERTRQVIGGGLVIPGMRRPGSSKQNSEPKAAPQAENEAKSKKAASED